MNTNWNKKQIKDRISFQNNIIGSCIWQTCLNCTNFENEICSLCGQTPPPNVIVVGCEVHSPIIPF